MIETTLIRLEFVALLGYFAVCAAAAAQATVQPVSWSASRKDASAARPGSKLTVDVQAQVEAGWHVYGLRQADGGPTPLRVTVDPTGVVLSGGMPSGTSPTRTHDKSFDLETEVYLRSFSLHVPVEVKPGSPTGSQQVGVNVRYQACNDHVCLPPKTVHLTVPVQIPSDTP